MHLIILPHEVLLDGRDLLKLRNSAPFLAGLKRPSRQRDIPMHPRGTRVAMVWDDIGLVAYEDRPAHQMSHLYFAFSPADTPEHPHQASCATIEINGGIVTAEITERTLPRKGPTPISTDFAKHFVYETEAYGIDFLFGRQPGPRGRGIVTSRLHAFAFSWRHAATSQQEK